MYDFIIYKLAFEAKSRLLLTLFSRLNMYESSSRTLASPSEMISPANLNIQQNLRAEVFDQNSMRLIITE